LRAELNLLRILQEHEFERVGGTGSIRESKIRSPSINKKRFKTTNLFSSRSHSNTCLSKSTTQFRNFASVAKIRNPDAHQAT
jgi:transcriptional regulator with PAS, ATPase and Fis domain